MHITRGNPYEYLMICDYKFLRNMTPVPQHDVFRQAKRLDGKSGDNCHSFSYSPDLLCLCSLSSHTLVISSP